MMNNPSQALFLEHLALRFRSGIELALDNGLFDNHPMLRKFPTSCCGIVSDLLAIYLSDNGIQTKYVCGNYYYQNPEDGAQSHAWLQYENLVIDITGDQFKNNPIFLNYALPVYVGRPDAMHKLFEVRDSDIYDAISCDGPSKQDMKVYAVIKPYLS